MRSACLLLILSALLHAESAKLDCTADAWVLDKQKQSTNGRSEELWLQGTKRLILLGFRLTSLPGWRVTRATLFLHQDSLLPPPKFRVEALPRAWRESEATMQEASDGEPWHTEGTLRDLVFQKKSAASGVLSVTEKDSDWLELELAPAVVNRAIQAGGHGLVLAGSGRALQVSSRETGRYAPYLVVEGSAEGQ